MRLNFGCGPVQPDGWANLDPDPQWDAPYDNLAGFGDATVDLVVVNHVLMMVPWPELVPTLREIRRVLKPDRGVRIIEPDLLGAFHAYRDQCADWFPIPDTTEPTLAGKLAMYVTQAGATRSVFTSDWLLELCRRAGFTTVNEVVAGVSGLDPTLEPCALDSRAAESVFVEAVR